jgi:uncharacterized protein YlxP (DUF503 family)
MLALLHQLAVFASRRRFQVGLSQLVGRDILGTRIGICVLSEDNMQKERESERDLRV